MNAEKKRKWLVKGGIIQNIAGLLGYKPPEPFSQIKKNDEQETEDSDEWVQKVDNSEYKNGHVRVAPPEDDTIIITQNGTSHTPKQTGFTSQQPDYSGHTKPDGGNGSKPNIKPDKLINTTDITPVILPDYSFVLNTDGSICYKKNGSVISHKNENKNPSSRLMEKEKIPHPDIAQDIPADMNILPVIYEPDRIKSVEEAMKGNESIIFPLMASKMNDPIETLKSIDSILSKFDPGIFEDKDATIALLNNLRISMLYHSEEMRRHNELLKSTEEDPSNRRLYDNLTEMHEENLKLKALQVPGEISTIVRQALPFSKSVLDSDSIRYTIENLAKRPETSETSKLSAPDKAKQETKYSGSDKQESIAALKIAGLERERELTLEELAEEKELREETEEMLRKTDGALKKSEEHYKRLEKELKTRNFNDGDYHKLEAELGGIKEILEETKKLAKSRFESLVQQYKKRIAADKKLDKAEDMIESLKNAYLIAAAYGLTIRVLKEEEKSMAQILGITCAELEHHERKAGKADHFKAKTEILSEKLEKSEQAKTAAQKEVELYMGRLKAAGNGIIRVYKRLKESLIKTTTERDIACEDNRKLGNNYRELDKRTRGLEDTLRETEIELRNEKYELNNMGADIKTSKDALKEAEEKYALLRDGEHKTALETIEELKRYRNDLETGYSQKREKIGLLEERLSDTEEKLRQKSIENGKLRAKKTKDGHNILELITGKKALKEKYEETEKNADKFIAEIKKAYQEKENQYLEIIKELKESFKNTSTTEAEQSQAIENTLKAEIFRLEEQIGRMDNRHRSSAEYPGRITSEAFNHFYGFNGLGINKQTRVCCAESGASEVNSDRYMAFRVTLKRSSINNESSITIGPNQLLDRFLDGFSPCITHNIENIAEIIRKDKDLAPTEEDVKKYTIGSSTFLFMDTSSQIKNFGLDDGSLTHIYALIPDGYNGNSPHTEIDLSDVISNKNNLRAKLIDEYKIKQEDVLHEDGRKYEFDKFIDDLTNAKQEEMGLMVALMSMLQKGKTSVRVSLEGGYMVGFTGTGRDNPLSQYNVINTMAVDVGAFRNSVKADKRGEIDYEELIKEIAAP